MSTARHHAEWLSLLEISGPFLSMPVLLRAFPQGLEAHDPDVLHELRTAYEEWLDNAQGLRPDPAVHTAWVRHVLTRTLELPKANILQGQAIPPTLTVQVPEHGETLRPDIVIANPGADHTPRLLMQIYPPSQDLDKPVAGSRWKDPIPTRMMELLHGTGVRLGLVTNGERWLLVDAPRGDTTGYISWYASLWIEEHLTLRAFRSLLDASRFFNVPDDETLEALLAESAKDQLEVTNQLGYQVRRAVEVLIQAIDRADQDRRRELLAGISETTLYEAALTVMMRLVFLLSAEERKLLLLGDPLYDDNYAISTLLAQLEITADQHGEEVLERRYDAWCRLLATFRAVYGGIAHEDLKLLPYGGSLFNPDRFPFLEGRTNGTHWQETPADPLPISNRTVLHLLKALQYLQVKVPGGGPAEARRLSFRALDIEQIGHVYEGLLDHTVVRATDPVLGLAGTRDKEPETTLPELEKEQAKGAESFVEYLQEQTGRSASALQRAVAGEHGNHDAQFETHLRVACGNDEALFQRVHTFAALIRTDDFGLPVVIPAGSVYMTAGTDRRSTGTHYTPRSLTEPIVQHTLEPQVYIGPAEALPKEQWHLRPAADLLALKICDMAMGSGAFLVQADRYLAERLLEAWDETVGGGQGVVDGGKSVDSGQPRKGPAGSAGWVVDSPAAQPPTSKPPLHITPEGKPATGAQGERIIPDDPDERMSLAQRLVAERCLYGVDKNPLAVEMAKLSLWLATAAKDRPFTFLDHALKCGDSLVGADEDMFVRWSHQLKDSAMPLFDEEVRKQSKEARDKRRELESFEVSTPRDAERKAALLVEAEHSLERVRLGCDIIVGARLLKMKEVEREELLSNALVDFIAGDPLRTDQTRGAYEAARRVRAFHWPFVFPEVFEQRGFDAFMGNPPFVGGKRIRETLGDGYREVLYRLFPGSAGGADYCAFFFVQGFRLLRKRGALGLLATNTIAQGDTRLTGLETIASTGGTIYQANNNVPWPGTAAVIVNVIHIFKSPFAPPFALDGASVENISTLLDSTCLTRNPYRLLASTGHSFIGSFLNGMGFVLEPAEAQALVAANPRNGDVLFPYLNGEDLNRSPDQSPSRWVINFFDWSLEKAETYLEPAAIIRERVFPVRAKVNRDAHRKYWWHYGDKRPGLYRTIAPLRRVLAIALNSRTAAFVFVPKNIVYSHTVGVFASEDAHYFALLQSSFHVEWAWKYGSSLKGDLRYTPSDIFETYPFPANSSGLEIIGERYHEHRRDLMLSRQEGLTATYNRFHNPDEHSADIARLRELHVEMDCAVAAAYGWRDLELGHGFHKTKQGIRFTISEQAREEVLARLLRLNNERWEEEERQGLHKKGKQGKAAGSGAEPEDRRQKKRCKLAREGAEGYDAKLL